MVGILIGNALCFAGMAADAVSASRRTVRGILLVQCIGQVIYGVSAICLGVYSATAQNVVNILRNLLNIKGWRSTAVEIVLMALGLGLGLWLNNRGLLGLVPVLASLGYSLAVLVFKRNERALKISFALNALAYAFFNGAIWNVGGVIANVFVIISTTVFLIRDFREKK